MDDTEETHRQSIGANRLTEKVSNDQRNANSYWVRQRNVWRKEYRIISKDIKQAKRHYTKRPNKKTAFQLEYMQYVANAMMAYRETIRSGLISTAYPYV